MLPIGTVISIPERKKNIYKITSYRDDKEYVIEHCLRAQGYPLAGDRTRFRYPADRQGIVVIQLGQDTPLVRKQVRLADAEERGWFPQCITDTYRYVESSLSPENLTCDGELPAAMVERRRRSLLDLKTALDKCMGIVVSF